ncbi:hypothetical protein ACLOJK_039698 [Asimina triloba]
MHISHKNQKPNIPSSSPTTATQTHHRRGSDQLIGAVQNVDSKVTTPKMVRLWPISAVVQATHPSPPTTTARPPSSSTADLPPSATALQLRPTSSNSNDAPSSNTNEPTHPLPPEPDSILLHLPCQQHTDHAHHVGHPRSRSQAPTLHLHHAHERPSRHPSHPRAMVASRPQQFTSTNPAK